MTTPARGATAYTPLKDHSVHWNQTLSTVVRLDVDRDNGFIFPCPFKLVVMQRLTDGDHDSPNESSEIHRLGAVYLNLSEYVGHGPVERRYLLRESRTNATLKLTIELEFIAGQTSYIPPPLPKGEILTGLSNYLDSRSAFPNSSSAHNGRPGSSTGHYHRTTMNNGINFYGPYSNQEELEMDLFGLKRQKSKKSLNHSRSKLALSSNTTTAAAGADSDGDSDFELVDDHHSSSHHSHRGRSSLDDPTITITTHFSHPHSPNSPHTPHSAHSSNTQTPFTPKPTFFDVERLPLAYGTKTTETLIEAIFNPVKINEERSESPFTVFVPPRPPPTTTTRVTHAPSMRLSTEESTPRPSHTRVKRKPVPNIEVASVYSTSSIGTNNTASTSTSSSGSGSGALVKSVHSHMSGESRSSGVVHGGGRMKDWWKRTVGGGGASGGGPSGAGSRPGTPVGGAGA
ncbi:hypothetical protein NP233_g2657 [Leucocoprinus birnbaumii]|uniref:C2 NT-type domain-containing protein n=1 Tax=Leucocoprinus birnbaumii TaxID=56174 RepID=A0AAD5W475_9AGAR|nr:hypothetical protein NP233_g2657 [Leucocoprinus birnbaumii]